MPIYNCSKCGKSLKLLIKQSSQYNEHCKMVQCCLTQYFQCNPSTCTARGSHNSQYRFYSNYQYMKKHIDKYHQQIGTYCQMIDGEPLITDDVYFDDDEIQNTSHYGGVNFFDEYANLVSSEEELLESNRSVFDEPDALTTDLKYEGEKDSTECFDEKAAQIFAQKIVLQSSFQYGELPKEKGTIKQQSFILFFSIARIVFLANKEIISYLSIILSILVPFRTSFNKNNLKISNDIKLPTHPSHFHSMMTSKRNKSSLNNNLPMPLIRHENLDGHSYSPLLSIFQFVALTKRKDTEIKTRHLEMVNSSVFQNYLNGELQRKKETNGRNNVAVQMLFWSDGFEPNRSIKANRRGAWIMTVTFYCYDICTEEIYLVNTELLSSGPGKGLDKEEHNLVLHELYKDLKQFGSSSDMIDKPFFPFISRAHGGKVCNFFFNPSIIYLMDNIERRANFGLLAGNSNLHSIFGISCSFNDLNRTFSACKQCEKRIKKYCSKQNWDENLPYPSCKKCHGFSLKHLLDNGEYQSHIYEPNDEIKELQNLPGYHLFQKPGKLTNKLLIDSYITARDLFLEGHMAEADVRSYLGVMTYNTHTIDELISSCRDYANEVENIHDVHFDINTIKKPTPPVLLYFCPLENAVETMMHLTMNCIKQCQRAMFAWAKFVKNTSITSIISNSEMYFKSVQNVNAASFPALPFKTENMGGYVGENHKAYINLAPWIFRFLEQCEPDHVDLMLLEKRKTVDDTWTKKELIAYLYSREIHFKSKMNKKELLLLVKRNFKAPLVTKMKLVGGKKMRETIFSLNQFVSIIYDTTLTGPSAINRALAHAMLYLCNTVTIDGHNMKAKHSWMTNYSVVGMLRLPEIFHIALYPLCFYEGDRLGEGMVKEIRPLVWTGLREGWSWSAQQLYFRDQSLNYFERLLLGEEELSFLRTRKEHSRKLISKIRIYKSYAEVTMILNTAKAVFSFSLYESELPNLGENNLYTIAITAKHNDGRTIVKELVVDSDPFLVDKFGLSYFRTTMSETNAMPITNLEQLSYHGKKFLMPGLALPYSSVHSNVFAFILSDGKKRQSGKQNVFSAV